MAIKDYLEEKPVLKTERLLLRAYTPQDAADLAEWLGDPDIYTYWGRDANANEQEPARLFIDPRPHIKRKPSKDFVWGIVLQSTQKVIGEIQIFNIENDRMAKVAYRLSKAYWGQGITTEALRCAVQFCFEHTEIQRLYSDVDVRNIPSWKAMERCGFFREGLIRQGKMVSRYCDYYWYGLLLADYQAAQKR